MKSKKLSLISTLIVVFLWQGIANSMDVFALRVPLSEEDGRRVEFLKAERKRKLEEMLVRLDIIREKGKNIRYKSNHKKVS